MPEAVAESTEGIQQVGHERLLVAVGHLLPHGHKERQRLPPTPLSQRVQLRQDRVELLLHLRRTVLVAWRHRGYLAHRDARAKQVWHDALNPHPPGIAMRQSRN
jgi:hypothetical protein